MRADTLTPALNDVTSSNLWWSHYKAAAELVDQIMRAASDPGWIDALAHVLQEAQREKYVPLDVEARTLDRPGTFLKTLELGRAARRSLSVEG